MAISFRSAQDFLFTLAVTCISQYFLLRDRLNGKLKRFRSAGAPGSITSQHAIPSGCHKLNAVFVQPSSRHFHSSLLICHGIGETVEHWLPVQHLLALEGVASLVFDYCGYGKSSGRIQATQCEQDALAAFQYLQELTPNRPISLLGFSLGSGIAGAILHRVSAHHLILCAAFTSFRQAVRRIGLPARLAPPIWDTEETLRTSSIPVLLLHGEKDRLFPAQMARDLYSTCLSSACLVIVPKLTHDAPYDRPQSDYWHMVAEAVHSPAHPPVED